MNQQQAESVKDLAKPTVEAIKIIVGSMEKRCLRCANDAYPASTCPICNGTHRVKCSWEWEPKEGEWCKWRKQVFLIVRPLGENKEYISLNNDDMRYTFAVRRNELIPILHWEEIEGMLEEAGYFPVISTKERKDSWFAIYKNSSGNGGCLARGKSRQEAIMKAVIKFGEQMHGN